MEMLKKKTIKKQKQTPKNKNYLIVQWLEVAYNISPFDR